jgi:hypothetical protein
VVTFLRNCLTSVALAALLGCTDSLSPENFYADWGGEGARLILSDTQARFETSCWAGDLAIPVQIEGKELHAIGNLTSQGGAAGGSPETRAVILVGHLEDDELHLNVEFSSQLGPYRLRRNQAANIPGCP